MAKVGMIVQVYGHQCRIFKVHAAGTFDVLRVDGSKAYRLSGLPIDRAVSKSPFGGAKKALVVVPGYEMEFPQVQS